MLEFLKAAPTSGKHTGRHGSMDWSMYEPCWLSMKIWTKKDRTALFRKKQKEQEQTGPGSNLKLFQASFIEWVCTT